MKPHIVLKLHRQVTDDARIPDWQDFIRDKSFIKESIERDVDRVFGDVGAKFWVAKEYKSAAPQWSADEMREGLERTYRLILQEDYDLPEELVRRIKLVPAVEDARAIAVEESKLPQPQLSQIASLARARAADIIGLAYAHAVTKGARDVRIAVLDTGVNLSHPELRGKIVKRADFVNLEGLDTTGFIGDFLGHDEVPEDEVGHGTHVAGIVAARGMDMDEGVAPGCSLMAVRALATMKTERGVTGAGIPDNINAAIKWAADNGAHVINMSIGMKHTGGGLPHADVVRYALGKNVTVVAASGNDGTAERYYPGALPGVIAVGAVDHSGAVANFTSYGANITVVAPGVQIYSAFADKGYAFASGTSQASPFVAGAIGLMKSYALERGRRLTSGDITYVLKHTSDKVDTRLRNQHAGYGLINLADAFKLLDHMAH